MNKLRAPRETENRETEELKHLSAQQIEAFFRAVKSPRDKALFMLMYHRGLRATEPGLMDLSDWDPDDVSVWVRRLKGSKSARYPLLPAEERAVRGWIKVRGIAAGPLFTSRKHGSRLGRIQVFRLMRKYCELAGIAADLAHPHAMKHSCGHHLVDQGVPIVIVQSWLGHRNIQNTMIYVGADTAVKAETAKLRDWGTRKKAK